MNRTRWRRAALVLAAIPIGVFAGAPPAAAASWVIVPSPSPHVALNELNAVFARTATDAWAVGRFGETAEEDEQGGLVLRWNGTAWSRVVAPNPQFRDEILNAVHGSGANDVWAVGGIATTVNNLPRLPWALHWNGTAWSEVPVPPGPTGTVRSTLRGVVALSPTNAWAVGRSRAGTALIEHWDGTAWSMTTTPATGSGLNAIAAVSPTNIWAVGDAVANANGMKSALIMHYDGVAWQVVPNQVAVPSTFTHQGLLSLVALGANDIWAIGNVADQLSLVQPLIQHFNGTTWTRVAAPARPANTTHYAVRGLTAVAANDVVAVGALSRSDLTEDSMVLQWNGSAWSFASTPDSGATFDGLSGASATPGGGPVWAVGRSLTGNVRTTLVLRR